MLKLFSFLQHRISNFSYSDKTVTHGLTHKNANMLTMLTMLAQVHRLIARVQACYALLEVGKRFMEIEGQIKFTIHLLLSKTGIQIFYVKGKKYLAESL